MRSSVKTAGKARVTLWIAIDLLIFLTVVVLTAFFLRPLQADLMRRTSELRDLFLSRAEKEIGRRIEYESMGPSFFRSIDLRGIRLVDVDGQVFLSAARLKIDFSLWDLLSGDPASALRAFELDRPVLELDSVRDADLFTLLNRRNADSTDVLETNPMPFKLPSFVANTRLRIKDGSLEFTDAIRNVVSTKVDLDIAFMQGHFSISGRSTLKIQDSMRFPEFGRIQTSVNFRGDVANDFFSANLTIGTSRIETSLFSLDPQSALFSYAEANIELRKLPDKSHFDLLLRHNLQTGESALALNFESLIPESFISLKSDLQKYQDWFSSVLTGRTTISLTREGEFSYRFGIQAFIPEVGSVPASDIQATGFGNQEKIEFDQLFISTPLGSLDYKGGIQLRPLILEGELAVSGIRLPDGREFVTSVSIASYSGGISLFANRVEIGNLYLDALDAFLKIENDTLIFNISALRFREEQDYADIRLGKISLEGSYSFKNPLIQLSVSLDSFSAADAYYGIAPFLKGKALSKGNIDILEKIRITTEFFATSDLKDLSFNLPHLVVAYQDKNPFYAIMSLSGTKERISIQEMTIFIKDEMITGDISIDFSDTKDIAFSSRAVYRDIDYSLEGVLLDGRNISFRGDYDLAGNILFSDSFTLAGSVSANLLPLPIDKYRFSLGLSARFDFKGADDWNVALSRFDLEETSGILGRALSFHVEGHADQDGGIAETLEIIDSISPLTGSAQFDWQEGFRKSAISIKIADSSSNERYSLNANIGGDGISFSAYASSADASRFYADPYKLSVTAEIRGRWNTIADYDLSFKLANLNAEIDTKELQMSGSGVVSPDSIDLEAVRISFGDNIANISRIFIDRIERKAGLNSTIRGVVAGVDGQSSLGINLVFAPLGSWLDFKKALGEFKGILSVGRVRYGVLDIDPFSLSINKDRVDFSMQGGPKEAINIRLGEDGGFFVALGAPIPIRGTIIGTIAKGKIDAGARGLYLDYGALWSLLNFPMVSFPTGIANANLRITGPLGDPDITGSALATGFRALVPGWIEGEIGPVSARIEFEGKDFWFGPVPAKIGKGKASLSGRFRFDRWIPSTFTLNVSVPAATPIPAKARVAGVIGQAGATGRLVFSNESGTFDISGRLGIENASLRFDSRSLMETQGQSPGPVPVTCSIELVTGKKVEFVWPNSDFPILRGYADTGNSLKLKWDGMSSRFSVLGDISLRGGEVFYFQRSFYIREGRIRFNESEFRFDPLFSVRAEVRERNDEGPLILAFVVDEARLSTFVPRFESIPSLSQAEIFSLLGQNLMGVDPETGEANLSETFISASSDVLAQFNVVRVFERNARDLLGLDMFSVRTQLLQNAFLGAAGLTQNPVDRIVSLGNYFDNTTVYMGKFLGSDIFLQAMLSLSVDETQISDTLGGLKLEPDIGIDWKTPLFQLRWSFLPTHPENLFIDDHSFTFSWRKSF